MNVGDAYQMNLPGHNLVDNPGSMDLAARQGHSDIDLEDGGVEQARAARIED